MQINGEPIEEGRLIGLMDEIKPAVEAMRDSQVGLPSYFEILVASSFLYFSQEKVGWAVIEVGLGGRLDATNVLMPEVSVITNIDLDHTEILGDTVEEIAKEKAGIIKGPEDLEGLEGAEGKKGVPVLTSASGGALKVIENVAKNKNAPLIKISTQDSKDFLKTDTFSYIAKQNDVFRHYPINAISTSVLLSFEVLKTLKIDVGEGEIKGAFKKNFTGRFERIADRVILDGAHNAEKIKSLINFIRKLKVDEIELVVGFKQGKNWKEMVDLLVKELLVKKVVATKYEAVADTGKGSAVKPEEIVRYVESNYQLTATACENSNEAVFKAVQGSKDLVLVTGSLYLVGEVREMFWGTS